MKRIWRLLLPAMLLCILLPGCAGGDGGGREYEPGARSESEYSSEWAGLRYTLGDNMVMATDEEINSMMELGAEALSDQAKLKTELAKLTSVYELMAVDVTNQSNIIICTEKLSLSNVSEEQYLDSVKAQLGEMYQEYAVTYGESGERELGGLAFKQLDCAVEYGGASMYQTYLVRKIDDRMYGIILSYTDDAALEALLSGFSAY